LIDFLNALLPEYNKIKNLSFRNTEQLGITNAERKSVFDIYCENERGEKFIVELQKAKQNFFKERTIFYSTFPIREQAEKGATWGFDLKAVYCIGILDFTFDDYESEPQKSEVVHTVKLKDQNNKVFYDKLTYIYLEMPNFKKTEEELKTRLDQWLFFLKNLEDFQTIPEIFKDKIFTDILKKAEIANFNQEELYNYEMNLKAYRDMHNVVATAFEDGKAEGKIEGKIEGKMEIAQNLLKKGMPIEEVCSMTGLSKEQIEQLRT
jgi:predicted transposase/invertase (TIGR01784 family)